MTRTRTLSALAGALTVGGLILAATPASAAVAVLPEQDDLYAITSYNEIEGLGENLQLVSLDPTNVDGTPVGSGTPVTNFDGELQAAYDALRGVSWAPYVTYDSVEEVDEFFLAMIDVTTGVTTTVGEILDGEGNTVSILGVMVGTDGVLYGFDDNVYGLWKIDPTSAVATYVAEAGHFHSFAFDPVTNAYYGIEHEEGNPLYEINVTTGALTLVAASILPDGIGDSHSMQFDSNGVLWVTSFLGSPSFDEVIATYSLGGPIAEVVGVPNVDGSDIVVSPTILITRGPVAAPVAPVEPTLAATGSDAGPVVLFGGLLLAAGAAVVLGRVASRRSAV